jgi:hypothetical protein
MSTAPLPQVQARLHGLLRRTRTLWRLRCVARGVVLGVVLAAATLALLLAGSALGLVPSAFRAPARWLPILVLLVPVAATLFRALARPPTLDALALRIGEQMPEEDGLAPALLHLPPKHPYGEALAVRARPVVDRCTPRGLLPSWLDLREGAAALLLLAVGAAGVLHAGGPLHLWSAWGATPPPPAAAAVLSPEHPEDAPPFRPLDHLEMVVTPPAYTGLEPFRLSPDETLTALAGSRVELHARSPELAISAQVIRGDGEPRPLAAEPAPQGWTLESGDRGLALALGREGDPGAGVERVIPVEVLPDGPPQVELLEPERDLTLATGSGRLTLRAHAFDPFGVETFELNWVHTRGSGESFDFREGSMAWSELREDGDGVEGALTLDLDALGMGPGDVLHLRATATDGNRVTGPGTGVSRTRQLRVIREGDEFSVDALVGLPLDVEDEPLLSQRMILLMTEALRDRASDLDPRELEAEARAIARQQVRLRDQVGEQVFSRATGAMEPGDGHLGGGAHDHGDPAEAVEAELRAQAARQADDDTHDHAHDEPPPRGSRYGVAAIFDTSAPDPVRPEPPRHDHVHAGTGADEAGTGVGTVTVGGPGALPTGFGVLDDLGHDHDGDPILSVSEPLLAIYNAMWESARFLELAAMETSIPHQEDALAGLQALRENERVFPRGHVSAPPVDVPGVRGTGEVDDAAPAPRIRGTAMEAGGAWVPLLEERLAALRRADDPRPAGRALSDLAMGLLGDAAVPSRVGGLVARAAAAVDEDRPAEGIRQMEEALRLLDPDGLRPDHYIWPGRSGASRASVLLSGGLEPPGDSPPPEIQADEPAPFVFATLRYDSGNWDSAPLVPQNLIHALAQYTDLPVAPEGVHVDLASPEIFHYPVLYLTGHLPVRFSDAEARNLEAYVERGGFVFMDDHNHDIDGAFHRTATEELARIFGDDALQPLPGDHALYRSFFHFEDGPPTTSHELSGWGDGLIHPELHAVMAGDRIGVLYSNKDYSSEWNYHAVNKRFLAVDNTRFGVNILIHALTR